MGPPLQPSTSDVAAAPPAAPGGWHVKAAKTAVVSGCTTFFVLVFLMPFLPKLPTAARLWAGLLPMQVVAFAAVLTVMARHCPRGTRAGALGLERQSLALPLTWRRGLVTLLLVYPAVVGVTALSAVLLNAVGLSPQGSPMVALLLRERGALFWLSAVVGLAVLAPLAEEILFRLCLFEALARWRREDAEFLTALLFAAAHQVPEEMPGLLVLGLVLQRARARWGTLWVPVMVHVGFNAVSLVFVLLARWWRA